MSSSRGSSSRSSSTGASNIIVNPDFSGGLASWHTNGCRCRANVVPNGQGGNYAVVTDRKKDWQGLEQDITGKVSAGVMYTVSARVSVSNSGGKSHVEATLRLEYQDADPDYETIIERTSVSSNHWQTLEGQFSLQTLPYRKILFYLEGPDPGVDLLINSVSIERAIKIGERGIQRFFFNSAKEKDLESLSPPKQLQGASNGDKNTNSTGGAVSVGDTTMEGGIAFGNSSINAPISIGTTTVNYQLFATQMPELARQLMGTQLSQYVDQLNVANLNIEGDGYSIGNTNIEGG